MPVNPYKVGQNRNNSSLANCAKTAGLGFGMGAAIGTTFGVLFGGMRALADPKIAGRRVRYVAGVCTQSGAMFGVFVAAGFLMRGC
mmetsp:Transcript_7178/g.17477  ORF Transcript_7178/g.17477 Transcript_7178/m.17477 type:complete len:86 (+) Transcript_7178:277-534(+)